MKNRNGFTLLEVMVATLIMGIAVVGVLSALTTSVRAASRLTSYDRAVMLSRSKMDEILTDKRIPFGATIQGKFDDNAGWEARLTPFEMRTPAPIGTAVLERVELEIWWMEGGQRQTFPLEGYRRSIVMPTPVQ